MNNPESLYSQVVARFEHDVALADVEYLPQSEQNFHFAMRCNGYFLLKDGNWIFSLPAVQPFTEVFAGQSVSFFGPGGGSSVAFFPGRCICDPPLPFSSSFGRKPVIDVIGKYRQTDESQAARIAFIAGCIVRYFASGRSYPGEDKIANAVEFIARKTILGEKKSGEALASAMAMYVISGGSLGENRSFTGNIYQMAEAIREDPVTPSETEDLGESQVVRWRNFQDRMQNKEPRAFPGIAEYKTAFGGFPTVGAEFHFPSDAPKKYPDFWERLAILNMSQYQRGSFVQLSRNDRDVIEVRMNPSFYPITIANWKYMKLLLPELNHAFFTITINRKSEGDDFKWTEAADKPLLNKLRALGMLSYASLFENIPPTEKQEEVNFGTIYLGQTVRLNEGQWRFTGNWGGKEEGYHGQLAIYAGFGDNLPYLAYYLSMALADPSILEDTRKDSLLGVKTLEDALALKPSDRRIIFNSIQNRVENNERLDKASKTGNQIIEDLSSSLS